MPVHNIRDTIEGTITTNDIGFGYMTRRINLEEGYRYDMLSVDVYNDNGAMTLKVLDNSESPNVAYQLYVSPYPMQQVGGEWGFTANAPGSIFPGGGQMAGDANVLYKEIGVTGLAKNNNEQIDSKILVKRFPNDAVSSVETSRWYSPHVYFTVMIWNDPEVPVNVKHSVFMRVDKKKAGSVSSSMGRYGEFLDSQIRLLTDTAVVFDPSRIQGYTFPMWKYGGIRPELMISGATALRYYNRAADNASQGMVSRGDLQTAFTSATTMVNFDSAFGDPALNLPEWITLMDVEGVTAGAIRPYAPPLKFADNGNTLMF
jgi:hypothetical protein